MMKNNIFIEFNDSKLKNLSEKIYDLFNKNDYNVTLINNTNQAENIINNQEKSFILSNKINNDSNSTIEIVYPLKSDDTIAKKISEDISRIIPVTKYYQLRDNINTASDYYEILRNNNKAIVIKYGQSIINNSLLPQTIYQAINSILNEANIYIVKSGDSLYAISKKYNTTVDELKRINNLTSNNLAIGQKLIIPTSNNINNQIIYTVKSGDSLYAISKKYNTTVDELKRINNLTSNNLAIGQKLIIPTSNNINNQIIYTVKSGDSLYAISKKYNTTVDELKRINNLTSNNLAIGQKLIIP